MRMSVRFFALSHPLNLPLRSSGLLPFASHPIYAYPLNPLRPLLSQCGALAQKYGHRLTTHPGQYVQLASPSQKVLDASVKELIYHADMLDAMGIGKDGVMVVHVSRIFMFDTVLTMD
jgi:UV DNA damage endonuclease